MMFFTLFPKMSQKDKNKQWSGSGDQVRHSQVSHYPVLDFTYSVTYDFCPTVLYLFL
jgi:hypothetical protein